MIRPPTRQPIKKRTHKAMKKRDRAYTLAKRIAEELHVDTLESLEAAAHDGRLAAIEGIGLRRAEMIERDSRDRASVRFRRVLGGVPLRRPDGRFARWRLVHNAHRIELTGSRPAGWIRRKVVQPAGGRSPQEPVCGGRILLIVRPVWLLLIFSGRARACSPRRGEAKRKSDQCFALASHRGSRSGKQPDNSQTRRSAVKCLRYLRENKAARAAHGPRACRETLVASRPV